MIEQDYFEVIGKGKREFKIINGNLEFIREQIGFVSEIHNIQIL